MVTSQEETKLLLKDVSISVAAISNQENHNAITDENTENNICEISTIQEAPVEEIFQDHHDYSRGIPT